MQRSQAEPRSKQKARQGSPNRNQNARMESAVKGNRSNGIGAERNVRMESEPKKFEPGPAPGPPPASATGSEPGGVLGRCRWWRGTCRNGAPTSTSRSSAPCWAKIHRRETSLASKQTPIWNRIAPCWLPAWIASKLAVWLRLHGATRARRRADVRARSLGGCSTFIARWRSDLAAPCAVRPGLAGTVPSASAAGAGAAAG